MIKYCPQNQHPSDINNEIQTSRTTTTTTRKDQQISFFSTTIDSSSVMELDSGNLTPEEKAKASQKYKSNQTRSSECTCDPETVLNQMDPWVLAGIAGGLVLAIAIGVTACCW